jgi:formylglycine-generating enzyme required for sulfatase activity
MDALRYLGVGIAFAMLALSPNAQAQPRQFQDCGDCPSMLWIPAGSFTMGVPAGEEEREAVPGQFRGFSVPQTRITIGRRFAMGQYPVTRGQFAAFVAATGHNTGNRCWIFGDHSGNNWGFAERQGYSWRAPGFSQTDQHPVVCVSWDDAQAYARWLSQRTGKAYRLPSESEWEYVARAGSPMARFWGNRLDEACAYANVRDLSLAGQYNFLRDGTFFPCADGFAHTSPVGSFRPNAFQAFDALGNVWQWTQDCWNDNLQGQSANGNARATGDCALRVLRGGSWVDDPWNGRAGNRIRDTAGIRLTNAGFRVARTE